MKRLSYMALLCQLAIVGCRMVYVNYTDSSNSASVRTLQLTDTDVSGWRPKASDPFSVYVGNELFNPINGGASLYLDMGCIETAIQGLEGPSSAQLIVYVMDFGTIHNAEAMFLNRKTAAQEPKKVPSFDETTAIYDNSIVGGVTGYAFCRNFYFELQFTGFVDKKQAIQALDLFLKIYLAKMQ